MQQQQKETKRLYQVAPSLLKALAIPTKRMLKQKRTPGDVQSFVDVLKRLNFPEEKLPQILANIDEIRASEDRSENYKSDRLYVGGIGILDLILFQVLGSAGPLTISSGLAWIMLVPSLSSVAGFFYISSLKDAKNIPEYSIIHEKLATVAVITGGIAAIAVVWHFWVIAGVLAFLSSLTVLFLCILYKTLINDKFRDAYMRLLTSIGEEIKETPDEEKPSS